MIHYVLWSWKIVSVAYSLFITIECILQFWFNFKCLSMKFKSKSFWEKVIEFIIEVIVKLVKEDLEVKSILPNRSYYSDWDVSDIVSKAKDYVKETLENEKITSENWYYYHNWDHTFDVFNRASYLAIKEWLDRDDIEILQLAALFHDLGFVRKYDWHEFVSADLAIDWLLEQGYPEEKIKKVEETILATIPTSSPKNMLEKIIKDADLDNLWRQDFFKLWEDVRKELELKKWLKFTDKQWYENTKKLLESTNFFTFTQKQERNQQLYNNIKKADLYLRYPFLGKLDYYLTGDWFLRLIENKSISFFSFMRTLLGIIVFVMVCIFIYYLLINIPNI